MVGFPSIGASCNNRRQQSKQRVLTKETFHLLINYRRKHRRKVAIHKTTNIQQKTYHWPLELSLINQGRFGFNIQQVSFSWERGEKRGGGAGVTHLAVWQEKSTLILTINNTLKECDECQIMINPNENWQDQWQQHQSVQGEVFPFVIVMSTLAVFIQKFQINKADQ